uniref:Uncharacterized protein n=1 Tax=Aegilops tauschii TaxID=37682 RepID=M8CCE9_AEGTA
MGSAWSSSSSAADPVIDEIVKSTLYGVGCRQNFVRVCNPDAPVRDMEACAQAAEALRRCMQANAVMYEQLRRSRRTN